MPRSLGGKLPRGPRTTASPYIPGKLLFLSGHELDLSPDVNWICLTDFIDVRSVFSLLKNEILGAQIEDFKETSDERRAMAPLPEGRNLFSYRPKR